MSAHSAKWADIGAIDSIPIRGARVVKTSAGCIAVFRTAADQAFAIEVIAALVQLYREQGRYLERIYKWAKRVGLDTVRQQIMADPERRKALYERFVFSQKFSQSEPWNERAHGKDAHEFAAMADLTIREAAE